MSIDGSKEIGNIHVDNRFHLISKEMLMKRLDRIVAASTWPEPVETGPHNRLIDAFKHFLRHLLNDFVLFSKFQITDSKRSCQQRIETDLE